MEAHHEGFEGIIETTVAELKAGDVCLTGFPDRPTVASIQPIGPVTIIDMADGTATAPVPSHARLTVRRGDGDGIWECYGCGFHIPSLHEGANTRCPVCRSYELHLSDEAKRSMK